MASEESRRGALAASGSLYRSRVHRLPARGGRCDARYNRSMERALLRGAGAARFLSRYWQKRPLLIRQAIAGFRNIVSRRELIALAARDDVEARLIVRARDAWTLAHGPFRRRDFGALPPRNWTLLVQSVNLHVAAADALLRRFSFLPYARLDDLMVSYAAPGGGVGPHFDSYDVFLLQGEGRRRWRLSRQRDLALKPGLPLKILARFRAEHECILDAGDLLYLPPQVAHDGVAVDACSTYSIGFRAPSAQELATGFLDWLRDRVALDGRYRDPQLAPTRAPARIDPALQRYAMRALSALAWDERTVARFLGEYLTEPKPAVAFAPPRRALSPRAFAAAAARRGLRLDSRTQLLYDARNLFVNGVASDRRATAWPTLRCLAEARALPAGELDESALNVLYRWYRDGFLRLG
jgi:50S ribosomal protein L16 3-hydroxylase